MTARRKRRFETIRGSERWASKMPPSKPCGHTVQGTSSHARSAATSLRKGGRAAGVTKLNRFCQGQGKEPPRLACINHRHCVKLDHYTKECEPTRRSINYYYNSMVSDLQHCNRKENKWVSCFFLHLSHDKIQHNSGVISKIDQQGPCTCGCNGDKKTNRGSERNASSRAYAGTLYRERLPNPACALRPVAACFQSGKPASSQPHLCTQKRVPN